MFILFTVKMYHYLPDYVMPYTIHLLAHDPDLKAYDDMPALKNIKELVGKSLTTLGGAQWLCW